MNEWKNILLKQIRLYPKMQLTDIIKLCFHHVRGPEHAVASSEQSLQWLEDELSQLPDTSRRGIEDIGGGFCRLHLGGLAALGLSPATLNAMFVASASGPQRDMDVLVELLRQIPQWCCCGELPYDALQAREQIEEYIASGCPAVHHSPVYRAAYHPAYRVLHRDFVWALPLFCAIDRAMAAKTQLLVAIDGNSGGGKSTLGNLLAQVYDCNLFHMDDYFLQLHQRTPQRFAQPGENIDHERFAEEILAGVQSGKPFVWHRFDCSQMTLGPAVEASPKPLTIVEGVYSLHPALCCAYDLKAFVSIDPQMQSRRILERSGPVLHRRFVEEWIPFENRYFSEFAIESTCQVVLRAQE